MNRLADSFASGRSPGSCVVQVCRFPDGSLRGSAVHAPVRVWPKQISIPSILTDEQIQARREDNARRSLAESAKRLARFIRFNNLTQLLTFTNGAADGWSDGYTALNDVSAFLNAPENRALFGDTPLASVAEQGAAGGRWHVHCAVRPGWLPYSRIIATWSAHMESLGYVSTVESGVHRFHSGDEHGKGKRGFSSARVAAGYMVKYLTKAFADTSTRRMFKQIYRSFGGSAPVVDKRRVDSLREAVAGLSLRSSNIHALEWHNGETGETHLWGLLFDTG